MDLMSIRRKMLMASGRKAIDTTVKIFAKNSRWGIGGKIYDDNYNIASVIYEFEPQNVARRLFYDYLNTQLIIFENGVYKDYWTTRTGESDSRSVINANSNGIAVSVGNEHIDDAYAYLPDGQILFAGKNSPYYGYTNINDMP